MKQRSLPRIDCLESRTLFTGTGGIGPVALVPVPADPPVSAAPVSPVAPSTIGTGVPVHAIQNVAFDDELGTLPALPLAIGRQYYGTVHWGDGTTSPATFVSSAASNAAGATVLPSSGAVEVFGAHKYAAAGMFDIVVDISVGARSATGGPSPLVTPSALIAIGDLDTTASVAASPLTFDAVAGQSYNGPVGSFASTLTLANYTTVTTINWGDGTTSTGTIVYDGDGVYHVVGTHVYTKPGDYAVQVNVTAQRKMPGTAVTATGTVSIPPVILVASLDGTADVTGGVSTAA
jgi:hypothetical protein